MYTPPNDDHLDAAHIESGYTALPEDHALIKQAQQAARTIRWLTWLENTPDMKRVADQVAQEYAIVHRMPYDEVLLDHITDTASLTWVWRQYREDIEGRAL